MHGKTPTCRNPHPMSSLHLQRTFSTPCVQRLWLLQFRSNPGYGFLVFLKRCNCILTVMMRYPVAGKDLPWREQRRGLKSCAVLQACAQSSFFHGTRPGAACFAPPGNSAHARSHARRRDALPGRNVSPPPFIALVHRVSGAPRVHVALPRIVLTFDFFD